MHCDIVSSVEEVVCHNVEEIEMFCYFGKSFLRECDLDVDWLATDACQQGPFRYVSNIMSRAGSALMEEYGDSENSSAVYLEDGIFYVHNIIAC
jgi:hypothetical protein